ncbi:DUF551 domain-containing protein [Acinetobacter phage 4316]|nr:DUF551 domain-containing protein [Acinetobacter phage 4316]
MINEAQEKQAHEDWYKDNDPLSYKFYKALSPEYEADFYTSEKAWLARAEAKAQAVPDTHVVVPRVPTAKMLSAGCSSISYGMTNEKNSERIYKAMVEASESEVKP